jgi:hypothetical protein
MTTANRAALFVTGIIVVFGFIRHCSPSRHPQSLRSVKGAVGRE